MATTNELLSSLQRKEHYLPSASLDLEDEERLQYLKGATRDTRCKIEMLENELYNKEKAYEAELSLRKSLEQRLSSRLVDMYSNAGVTSELSQRLPRSQPPRLSSDRPGDLQMASSTGGLLMTSPGMAAPLVLSPVSLPFSPDIPPDRHESRQLSSLLSELETLKDVNRRLQTRLLEATKETEMAKRSADGAQSEVEALVAAQVADMVKEVHAAQKSRDEAMMVRLRIANDERDAALTRLHETEHQRQEEEKEFKPQNFQQSEVTRFTSPTSQPHRADSNEVETLRLERDAAVHKFQQLQQEFNLSKTMPQTAEVSSNHADVDKQLERVKKERDEAVRRLGEMEDEVQTLRVYYSLHKSLSPEMISNQFGSHDADLLRSQNAALQNRVYSLTSDLEQNSRDLDETKEAKDKAEEELSKMGRLVTVLRRKLAQSEKLLSS